MGKGILLVPPRLREQLMHFYACIPPQAEHLPVLLVTKPWEGSLSPPDSRLPHDSRLQLQPPSSVGATQLLSLLMIIPYLALCFFTCFPLLGILAFLMKHLIRIASKQIIQFHFSQSDQNTSCHI